MYFNEENNYYNLNNDYDLIIFNRNTKLFDIENGFNKGNMFENLYSKYKNHVYKLKVNNEKDELLYKIQMNTFVLKDLTLYLDVYSNDTYILKEFQNIKKKLDELKNKYETKYGPLCAFDVNSNSKWTWTSNPWPWDKGGND